MNAAAPSCRVRTKRTELSRSASISSRFSSPGIPKAKRTPSFSKQETRSAAAFMRTGLAGDDLWRAGDASRSGTYFSKARFFRVAVTIGAGSVLDALLRSKEPSIQWKTRVHVLGEERDSKRVRALEDEIRRSPRVRALLSRRDQLGRPGTARKVYHKWQGVHWVLASLADIGYPEGDETLYPIRDRILEFWLKPSYFREFPARTEAEAYRHESVPVMESRYRRCASQQGNPLHFLTILGIADERAASLVERLLHWQWPEVGCNCDRHPTADTSSFMETRLPMLGLAAYARTHQSAALSEAVERASEVFLRRKLFKRASDGRVIHPDFAALHYPLYWRYDY